MRSIHRSYTPLCRNISHLSINTSNISSIFRPVQRRMGCTNLRPTITQLNIQHVHHYHALSQPLNPSSNSAFNLRLHKYLSPFLLSRSWRLRPKDSAFDWKEYQPLRRLPREEQHNQSDNQSGNQSENQSGDEPPYEPPYAPPDKAVFMTVSAFVLANLIVFAMWQTAAVTTQSAGLTIDERVRQILDQKQNWQWMMDNFTVSEKNLAEGRWHCLVTSAFSQMSLPHLLFNCIAIGSFGMQLGTVIGPRSFAVLYLTSAVAASACHVMYTRYQRQHSQWRAKYNTNSPALGASGAAMAIAVCYAMLFPYDKFLVMFVLPLPAWLCVSLAVAFDMYGAVKDDPRNPIGHSAHLGGAAIGFLHYMLRIRTRRFGFGGSYSLTEWKNHLRPKY